MVISTNAVDTRFHLGLPESRLNLNTPFGKLQERINRRKYERYAAILSRVLFLSGSECARKSVKANQLVFIYLLFFCKTDCIACGTVIGLLKIRGSRRKIGHYRTASPLLLGILV